MPIQFEWDSMTPRQLKLIRMSRLLHVNSIWMIQVHKVPLRDHNVPRERNLPREVRKGITFMEAGYGHCRVIALSTCAQRDNATTR